MAVPQGTKKVGPAGCIVSILLFFLGIGAFIGLLIWATVGVVNDLKVAPSVPLGTSGTVNLTTTGEQFLFLGDLEGGGTIPLVDPIVTVTDPSGNEVTVSAPSASSSGSSGSGTFRTIGEFNAKTTGTYTIDSTGASRSSGAKIYVSNLNVASLGAKILAAVGVGGVFVLLSIILAIVWLVRRSKNKSSAPPAYPGGYPPQYPPQYPPSSPPQYPQQQQPPAQYPPQQPPPTYPQR